MGNPAVNCIYGLMNRVNPARAVEGTSAKFPLSYRQRRRGYQGVMGCNSMLPHSTNRTTQFLAPVYHKSPEATITSQKASTATEEQESSHQSVTALKILTMKLVLCLFVASMTTLAYGIPVSTESEGSVITPTQPPTTPQQSLKRLSQNASLASLESWQSAAILLNHIENVILAGYEVPPSPTCFQEERDPITYEHPHPSTDFQAYLVKDYASLLRYRDYFNEVSTIYEKSSAATTSSQAEEESVTHSSVFYRIELADFISSLNGLLVSMEKYLRALSPTALSATEAPPPTTTLPTECYEICYGQQVSVLEDYLVLAYNYIPSDISGQSDSKKKN